MKSLRLDHPGLTLLLHLFREYLAQTDCATDVVEEMRIREFFAWTVERRIENEHLQHPLFPDHEELMRIYDVDEDTVVNIAQILSDPFTACQHLLVWWPMLTLSPRKPLKNKPVSVSLIASFKFEDGTLAHLPHIVGRQTEPYSDGLLLTVLNAQFAAITRALRSTGVDTIYSEVKNGRQIAPIAVNPAENPMGI